MQTVTIDDAQKSLKKLVQKLASEEILITDKDKPVARLTSVTSLRDLKPSSVGALLRPYPDNGDDLLGEMLDAK